MVERNLGKLLFPRAEPWQRRRKFQTLLVVIVVGIITGGLLALLIIERNLR
jgi:hypothetical protein